MISIESLREPGTTRLSATVIAGILGMRPEELAEFAGVRPDVLKSHPESARVQKALCDLARVLTVLAEQQPDVARVVFHLKNTPLRTFGGRTLLEVIRVGRIDDAIAYLDSVLSGAAG
jgi:hypothetical protein